MRTSSIHRRTLLAAGALALAAGEPTLAMEDPKPDPALQIPFAGPFSDVPTHLPAYVLVHHLAREYGVFTGYPDGSFCGKRALTRYEFAVALQRMLQGLSRAMMVVDALRKRGLRVGDPFTTGPNGEIDGPHRHFVDPAKARETVATLRFLTDEFALELAMLGADVVNTRAALDGLRAGIEEELEALKKRAGAKP